MKSPARGRRVLWMFVVLYAALIIGLSSFSFHFAWFQSTQKSHLDKLIHVVEYSFFGALLCRAVMAQGAFRRWGLGALAAVLLAGVLYGVLDEWHQRSIPGRDSSPYDVMADAIGAALGAWIWTLKTRKKNA